MSFILDALRKSEHERERSTLPGIADAPIVKPPPSKLPWILGGIGVLLALNVIVLLVVLLRPSRSEAPAAAAAPAASAAPAAAPASGSTPPPGTVNSPSAGIPGAVPVPATAARDVRPLTEEVDPEAAGEPGDGGPLDVPPVERDPSLERSDAPAVLAPPRPARAPLVRPVQPDPNEPVLDSRGSRTTPAPRTSAPAPSRTTGVPSIDDLSPQATAGLPVLAINLHVYSPDPAQRFVMLNGRRYVDGAQLQEGPILERITPDGVILNHRGLRFLLPRP